LSLDLRCRVHCSWKEEEMIFIVASKYVGNNIIGWLSIGEKGSDYCRLTTAETETTAQPMMPG
jgi:hypothetical protein